MSFALNTTAELLEVIRTVRQPTRYWLDLCFPRTVTFDSETIIFDELVEEGRRLAPFVAPNVQGKVMREDGFTSKAFKPAYVKPKHIVDPSKAFHRTAGEQIGGSLTPQQRWDATVARNMNSEIEMILNRCEWMAAQAIQFGEVTVSGENYPTRTVSFGRSNDLFENLTGANRWNQSGAAPLDDLESWMYRMQRIGVTTPTRITMGIDAWAAFRNKMKDEKILDLRRLPDGTTPQVNLGVGDAGVVQYKGTLRNGVDIYVYSEVYVNDAGAEVALMDSRDIVMTSPAVRGVRAFGAIMDARAGLRALEMFPKMWEQEDPSVVYTMTQSAPLMVPTYPNGTFRARVLNDA